jgi:hypothetical protein
VQMLTNVLAEVYAFTLRGMCLVDP